VAIQVLSGVEQQQGADRADVAGKTPKPFLSFILGLWLGSHTDGEVFQLLLGRGRQKDGWWVSTPHQIDPHPILDRLLLEHRSLWWILRSCLLVSTDSRCVIGG
jgi:hypothetical protein